MDIVISPTPADLSVWSWVAHLLSLLLSQLSVFETLWHWNSLSLEHASTVKCPPTNNLHSGLPPIFSARTTIEGYDVCSYADNDTKWSGPQKGLYDFCPKNISIHISLPLMLQLSLLFPQITMTTKTWGLLQHKASKYPVCLQGPQLKLLWAFVKSLRINTNKSDKSSASGSTRLYIYVKEKTMLWKSFLNRKTNMALY